ncbi:MAG: hypothetical protein ACRDHE_09315 [Ktedonobacterales bacterium]
MLTDSIVYDERSQLLVFRTVLTAGSNIIQRAYVNYDFRPDFSPGEQTWHTHLRDALDVLERFPFDDMDAATASYNALVSKITAAAEESLPPPTHGSRSARRP